MTPIVIRHPFRGFTLIELMVTVSILATLSAVAIPSFASILAKSKVQTMASSLHTTLNMARNHAITSQAVVMVCQASDSTLSKCVDQHPSNENWKHGWLIYQDDNSNNKFDHQDQLLRVFENGNMAVVFNQRGRLRFFPDGSARSAGFYICNNTSDVMRHVRLLYTGRSRIDKFLGKKQRTICEKHAQGTD